ncbi:MAG: hypothetical protein FJX97_08940 [Bacteroidetes bacterium]|nr:hypothetical protein [Bacteroidota bacterium]
MRLLVTTFLLLLPIFGQAQERGLGFRFGEPFSISYKDFVKDYLSYEVLVGSGSINRDVYYQKSFNRRPPRSDARVVSLSGTRGVALSFRMALHTDLTDAFELEEGYLLGYAGLGAQFRTTQVNYQYTTVRNSIYDLIVLQTENRTNGDLGPEAFVGAEYYFDPVPFSLFVEAGVFTELIDRAHGKGQVGIGIRYLF